MVKIDQPVEVESGNKVLNYPLDKDFSMVVEGTQMKEGFGSSQPGGGGNGPGGGWNQGPGGPGGGGRLNPGGNITVEEMDLADPVGLVAWTGTHTGQNALGQ